MVSVDELQCLSARGDGEMMMMAPPFENKEEETRRGEGDGALMVKLSGTINKDGGWSLVKKKKVIIYMLHD